MTEQMAKPWRPSLKTCAVVSLSSTVLFAGVGDAYQQHGGWSSRTFPRPSRRRQRAKTVTTDQRSSLHRKFSSGDSDNHILQSPSLGSLQLKWETNSSTTPEQPLIELGSSILRSFGGDPAHLGGTQKHGGHPHVTSTSNHAGKRKKTAPHNDFKVHNQRNALHHHEFETTPAASLSPAFTFDLPQALRVLQSNGTVATDDDDEPQEAEPSSRLQTFMANRGIIRRRSTAEESGEEGWRPVPLGERLLNSVLLHRQQSMDGTYINMVARLLRSTHSVARFQGAVDDFRGDDSFTVSMFLDEVEALFMPRDWTRVVAPLASQLPEAHLRAELRDELLKRQPDKDSLRMASTAIAHWTNATATSIVRAASSSSSTAALLLAPPGSPGGGFRSSEVKHSPPRSKPQSPVAGSMMVPYRPSPSSAAPSQPSERKAVPKVARSKTSSTSSRSSSSSSKPAQETEKKPAVTSALASALASSVPAALVSRTVVALAAIHSYLDSRTTLTSSSPSVITGWISAWLPSAIAALERHLEGRGGASSSKLPATKQSSALTRAKPPPPPPPARAAPVASTWSPPKSLPRQSSSSPKRMYVPPEGLSWAPAPVLESLEAVEGFFATVGKTSTQKSSSDASKRKPQTARGSKSTNNLSRKKKSSTKRSVEEPPGPTWWWPRAKSKAPSKELKKLPPQKRGKSAQNSKDSDEPRFSMPLIRGLLGMRPRRID